MLEQHSEAHSEAGFSPQQKSLWRTQAGSERAYLARCALQVSGAVDRPLLRRAVLQVVAQHDLLRTRWQAAPGRPWPAARLAATPDGLAEEGAAPAGAADLETLWQALADDYDPAAAAVLHYRLAPLADGRQLFLLRLPALYGDAAGLENLALAVWRAYAALQAAGQPDADVLQYADLAQWATQLLVDDGRAAGRAYWSKQAAPAAPALPFDHAPHGAAPFQPRSVRHAVAPELLARIDRIAAREQVPAEAFFLAAWHCLVARLCGAPVTIGLGCDGRQLEEIGDAVGLLGKYAPVSLDGLERPFVQLLRAAAEASRGARQWQEYFDPCGDPDGEPADGRRGAVLFDWRPAPAPCRIGALELCVLRAAAHLQRFKLQLSCCPAAAEGGVGLAFDYDGAAFSGAAVEIIASQYATLLAAAARDPQLPGAQLPLTDAAQYRCLTQDWNRTERDDGDGRLFHHLFEDQAAATPARVAVLDSAAPLDYAQLNARANQLAHHLRALGVGDESVVGICLGRSSDILVAVLAVLKAGGAYLPLDPDYPAARLAAMLAQARPALLLSHAALSAPLRAHGAPVLCLDSDWPAVAARPAVNPPRRGLPQQLAYLMFTSGSTGAPKGVQVTQQALRNFLRGMERLHGITPDAVLLNVTSLSFDIAGLELLLPLCCGARTVIAAAEATRDPALLCELIERTGVTLMQATPATWRMLVEHRWPRLPHELAVLCGGEALPPELARQLLERVGQVWNMYGPTETTIWSSAQRHTAQAPVLSIGRPIDNTRIYLLDERGDPVPIGQAGELYIGGAGLARGYRGRPDLTAERFLPDPWGAPGARLYRSGDLARHWPDGSIECLGRNDHQVKLNGFRIELGEIEAVLAEAPGVRQAVVVARDDGAGAANPASAASVPQRLVAYVTAAAEAAPADQGGFSMSLFFFGADCAAGDDPYQLYRQAAQFGDQHGFEAVWTPERHFHQVGSLYPNPSVLNAALAVLTRRIKLRAGSVVLPLHHPVRVAEEWAMVDNLSRGRVGLAVAAGWHPRDFVLAPDRYAAPARLAAVRDGIAALQALWRGDSVTYADGAGNPAAVRVFPRPVQAELPLWITAAGNPDTFVYAGQIGANLLTHLLGQTVEQVGQKIALYRAALAANGHDPRSRRVTLMVHTYVGDDLDATIARARAPFLNYMRSHLGLMESLVQSLGVPLQQHSQEDLENAVAFAFERYTRSAALIGTPASCLDVVARIQASGVDEIACMIDWMDGAAAQAGLAPLQRLHLLARQVRLSAAALRQHCQARLPAYMVPAAVVLLERLPLTPNGKIDRLALPAPQAERGAGGYRAPAGEIEQTLAALWGQALRREQVGADDNFFAIGGDSILAIQVIARARQGGLHFTPKQLFQHPTIAALARVAERSAVSLAEQGQVTGAVALTPIQHWFFELGLTAPRHFNQSVLLALRERLDLDALRAALAALLVHHDALRLVFTAGPDGWRQTHRDGAQQLLEVVDLSALDDAQFGAALERHASALQARCELDRGPLFRAAYFHGGARGDRLLCVCHHLLIDGVSWRIVLEDLQDGYARRVQGQPIALPAKTSSFQQWSRQLADYAVSGRLDGERAFWQRSAAAGTRWPAGPARAGAGPRNCTVRLGRADTEALLTAVPAAYRTQINDVLLTALALALSDWAGVAEITLDLEGHGREDLFDGLDVSRTVGWFTALFPVRLDLGGGRAPALALKAVKQQLRAIPNKGVGYGVLRYLLREPALLQAPPQAICFNYLGQTAQVMDGAALLATAPEARGRERAPHDRSPHAIEINAIVADQQLHLSWDYQSERFDEATVQALAAAQLAQLQALIAHCTSGQGGYTPDDFDLARPPQAWLDALYARHDAGGDAIEDIYPLTPIQQGILFHSLMAPTSGVYVQQMRCTLQAGLDLDAFERALQAMTDRHAVLRSAVAWQGVDTPLALVFRRRAIDLTRIDWRGEPAADGAAGRDGEQRLLDLLAMDRQLGFDLAQAPLQRFTLVRVSEDRYEFIWTCHYLLFDGWSFALLQQQFLADYAACADGLAPAALPVRPFRDYTAWLQGQRADQAEAYWRRALDGVTGPTPLMLDRGHPGRSGFSELRLDFDAARTQALQQRAIDYGITLNTLTQGVWAILLSRLSQHDDVVFGCTVAGRPAEIEGIETMIGQFINSLPVRARVARDAELAPWLQALQADNVEMRQFESTPLTRIHACSGFAAGAPLFDSLLVFENFPIDQAMRQPGQRLPISAVQFSEQTNYPLTLTVVVGERLSLNFSYDRSRFDAAGIGTLMAGYRALAESLLAAAPAARLGELALLGQAERRQLVEQWNDTGVGAPPAPTIHALFEAQAARTPQQVALRHLGGALSYAELDARAGRIARGLRARGVGAGALVGVCMERTPDLVAALLGVLKAGAAYVPLDPDYPRERLGFMLRDAGAALVLAHARWRELLAGSEVACWYLDGAEGGPEDGAEDCAEDGSVAAPAGAGAATDLAYVIYTSGSTGQPKGVAIEHRNAVAMLDWARATFTAAQRQGMLASTSVCFDLSVFELFVPLSWGGCVILTENALHLAGLPDLAHVSFVNTVPSAMAELVRLGQVPGSVQVVGLAGEPLQQALVQSIYQAGVGQVFNLYGPSECTTYSTFAPMPRGAGGPVSIGRPIAGTTLYILDREGGVLPLGVEGELYIGGAGVARGYLHRPELTAQKFVADPFSADPAARLYRTGDLARYRADGQVDFLGRLDHQVKLRGYRIELGEIEAALLAHEAVREALVLARADGAAGARLVAYLVGEAVPAAAALRSHLLRTLPAYMVPSAFVALAAMPLTPNGKIDRKALPAPDMQAGAGYAAAVTPTERALAALWQELLGLERVGLDDNFFDLGGHSLLLLQAHNRLAELGGAGAALALVDLYAYPTLRALAQRIDQPAGGQQGGGDQAAGRILDRAARQKQALQQNRIKQTQNRDVSNA